MAAKKTTAAPPKTSKAVAVQAKAGTTLATGDFEKDAGAGMENVGAKDLIIPRITILQALSPQLQKKKPEYIEGADAGDFCDTALGQVFKESMLLLPCFYARVFLEWAPRASGKGLVHNYGTDDSILKKTKPDEKNRNVLPSGNYIAETATYFCLNLTAGGRRCFVPLASTQLRAGRQWMTALTAEKLQRADGSEFTPPIYYRTWEASITEQSNAEGDWFGWRFSPRETILEYDPTKALLTEAKTFYEQARDGLVKGDVASMAEENAQAGAESAM